MITTVSFLLSKIDCRALLRPGRFDVEVQINVPDLKGRTDILNLYVPHIKVDTTGIDIAKIARNTIGTLHAITLIIVGVMA